MCREILPRLPRTHFPRCESSMALSISTIPADEIQFILKHSAVIVVKINNYLYRIENICSRALLRASRGIECGRGNKPKEPESDENFLFIFEFFSPPHCRLTARRALSGFICDFSRCELSKKFLSSLSLSFLVQTSGMLKHLDAESTTKVLTHGPIGGFNRSPNNPKRAFGVEMSRVIKAEIRPIE